MFWTLSLELAPRERSILRALVAEHTATGEPVGSRTITSRHELGLSPASVRAVLAHLEDLGLAWQPHSSAGRVPTQRGYRLYVDSLIEPRDPSDSARTAIDALRRSVPSESARTREVGRLLSSLTGAASVVTIPSADDAVLTMIRFVSLGAARLVAVLATRSGTIEHRALDETESFDESELERLHNYLATLAPGRTLRELRDAVARDLEGARRDLGWLHLRLERWLGAALTQQDDAADRVSIEGQERLFQLPEFADAERIRSYVDAFASRHRWLDLLERTLASTDVGIAIGDENEPVGLDDAGIVAVRYGRTGTSGILAVVGPVRIDYAAALPVLRYAARAMAEALDGQTDPCDDCR